MEIREVLLPGVGIRYEFATAAGTSMGLIARRDGQMELVVYDDDDADACREVARLTPAEAEALAELLGAPRIVESFADLTREVPGLGSDRVEVGPTSPFVGRELGSTRARTRTGASVVAIVRGDDVTASPTPSQVLQAGDVLVVIGTQDGIDGVRRIVDGIDA